MKKIIGFSRTCFVDKNNLLIGKLYLGNGKLLDFDGKTVHTDSETVEISASYMNLLATLIAASPKAVEYETLFRVFYGDKYSDEKKSNIQVLRNFKHTMGKHVRIKCVSKYGYKVVDLPERVLKLGDISADEVQDIPGLFSTLEACATNERHDEHCECEGRNRTA